MNDEKTYSKCANFDSLNPMKCFEYDGEFLQSINHDGVVYVLTTKTLYRLQRMHRESNFGSVGPTEDVSTEEALAEQEGEVVTTIESVIKKIPFIQIDEITLEKYFPSYSNLLVGKRYIFDDEKYLKEIDSDFFFGVISYPNYKKYQVLSKESNSLLSTITVKARLDGGSGEDTEQYNNFEITFDPIDYNIKTKFTFDPIYIDDDDAEDLLEEKFDELVYPEILKISAEEGENAEVDYKEDIGFSPTTNPVLYILTTVLYDDGSESKSEEFKREVTEFESNVPDYYGVKFILFPRSEDWNPRVLGYRVYLKTSKDDSYQLAREYLNYGENPDWTKLVLNNPEDLSEGYITKTTIGKIDLTGILLEQTIGYKSFEDAGEKISNFNSITFVGNAMFGVYGNKVLFPTIGNGKATFSFHQSQVIPNIEASLISSLQDSLAVFDNDSMSLIHVDGSEGVFIFTLKDVIGFLVKDVYDIIETPDGNILNTVNGIYVYNGNELKNISESINDVVIGTEGIGNISYDVIENVLWYFISGKTYIFQFENFIWREVDIDIDSEKALMFRDHKNRLFIFSKESLYHLILADKDVVIESHKINFSELGYLSKLADMTVDFEGELELSFLSGKVVKTIKNEVRKPSTFYIPIEYRVLNNYLEFVLKLKAGGKLFNYELNFDMEKGINEIPI